MEPLLGEFNIRVHTESQILEKVLKFDQQFSRPGKSLEKWSKVLRFSFCKAITLYLLS